jgi:hypothetical protein
MSCIKIQNIAQEKTILIRNLPTIYKIHSTLIYSTSCILNQLGAFVK